MSELILFHSIPTVTTLIEPLVPSHLVYFIGFLTSFLTLNLIQTFPGVATKFLFLT